MKYYKRVDEQGKTTTVESYSYDFDIPGAIEINKAVFDAYLDTLPAPVIVTPRDLGKEIDNLKAALTSKGIIP